MGDLVPGETSLAPYAAHARDSRGRRHPEAEQPFRSIYQRDRDRIIHSTAFRRLEYKTQVFVNREGDHYRTRLTHTLEVAQIARSLARALNLNEDLAEAVALAHDLGHTPFGHSGESAMAELMAEHGGFEHNRQGLRVVDWLEQRYHAFPGLNLSYEVREAFARHTTQHDHPAAIEEFNLGAQPLLEVQVSIVADEIAYDNHDIDDGLASGILRESEVEALGLWQRAIAPLGSEYCRLSPHLRRAEGVRRLIHLLVSDVIETSRQTIARLRLTSAADVRFAPEKAIRFSKEVEPLKQELESFLKAKFYQHYRVIRMTKKAQRFLRELFAAYVEDPRLLPTDWQQLADKDGLHRAVCDYISGMTDRYAEEEYRKLFHPFERT